MNELIPKSVRYQTYSYPRDAAVAAGVPPRLRAVVAPNLASQTRGSLAFLGFGARTLVSTLGDAACPVARVKGSSKPLRRVSPALGFRTRVGIVMIHLSAKAFGRQRRAVGEPGVPFVSAVRR